MDLTQLNFDFRQIAIWVVIWLTGYGLGLLEAWLRNRNKEKKDPMPENRTPLQAPPQLIEEDYALAVFEQENTLTLKLDKAQLDTPTTLNETQRKRLVGLVVKLRPWLEGKSETAQAQTDPNSVKPPVQPTPPTAAVTKQRAYGEYTSQPITGNIPMDDLEYNKLSMVEQIDWRLQKKLENHPLKARRIRLQNDPTGGVNFIIGEENYEFVDEIPYPEIKALIQLTISEWEKSG
jgi:hypothetical protein